ncbi:MAG: hypothetical protein QG579_318 [Patescibacteria group bacterium]|jgi:glycosyltransferase involved in cell wall biosynthesis|nr:hypothetical protein [Patescibacteria group bacterium]
MTNNLPKKRKKRILIFSTAYYPFVGGAEVAVKEITDRLAGDFDFDLITAKLKKGLPDREKLGSVNVYRVGVGSSFLDKILLPIRGAFLTHRLNKINNYYCFWGVMVTFGSIAGYIFNFFRSFSFKKKIPIILTLQEGDSENHLQYKWGGLISLSWKIALWRTDFLTAISNFLLNRAKKNGYKGDCALVPNGVDVSVFSKEIDQTEKEVLKNKLNKKTQDVFLVTSGRLTHKNGVDDVISALVNLPTNVSFIIIGKGEDGQKLQKQARDLGVSHRVKFIGFVPYSDIPKYFSVSDIFIRASRSEGFGNSFIEAMAAKLPVIATPVGGIVDFIDDRNTGIFCSPDCPQSIVKSVHLLLEDKNLKDKIILNSYKRVEERYEWTNIASQMKEVFKKI